jgi:6-phosphogluconolactonase
MKIAPFLMVGALLLSLMGAACASNGEDEDGKAFVYVAHSDDPEGFTLGDRISAFSLDESTGVLTEIIGSPFLEDRGAQGLAVHPSGKWVYAKNYFGEIISCLSVDPTTGALRRLNGYLGASDEARQFRIHPSGDFLYLMTRNGVTAYLIDAATGTLTWAAHAGSEGPWDLAFDPSGRFIYIVYGLPIGIEAYAIDASNGSFSAVPGSPFALGAAQGEVHVLPPGDTLCASIYEFDGIQAFSIDPATGALTPGAASPFTDPGRPWRLLLDPLGRFGYVWLTSSGDIDVYAISTASGAWRKAASDPQQAAGWTGGLAFDPSGNFLFTTDHDAKTISTYAVHPITGALIAKAVHTLALNPESIGVARIRK